MQPPPPCIMKREKNGRVMVSTSVADPDLGGSGFLPGSESGFDNPDPDPDPSIFFGQIFTLHNTKFVLQHMCTFFS